MMISIIIWRKADKISRYIDKNGILHHKILIIDSDGEIREGSYNKGMFECDSEGEAWEWQPMEPQPKYFAFKPSPFKFWWNK